MYIETRELGKHIKYYLVHSYREHLRVRKIRRYLGQDLGKEALAAAKAEAVTQLKPILNELNTEVFLFSLTKKQIQTLNRFNDLIKIHHLDQKEWQRLTEEFVYNTNAIEGSTVRQDEVKDLMKDKKPKNPDETETKDVAKAFEYIRATDSELTLELTKRLHELCFKRTKPFAGKFRDVEVVIRNAAGEIVHQGIHSALVGKAMADMIEWHNRNKRKFKPLVLAAIIHNQFEHIHPFQDGNGRVGRLLLNYILIKNNYPPINISLEDRQEYYQTLQEYSKNNNLKPTLQFLIKQYKKTLKQVSTKKKK
jgi:Fic family protein